MAAAYPATAPALTAIPTPTIEDRRTTVLPAGVAVDGAGNLDVADELDATLRKITPGATTTIAGTVRAVGHASSSTAVARPAWKLAPSMWRNARVFAGTRRDATWIA